MCRGLLYRISTDDLSRDGSTLCGITDCKDMCKAANVFFSCDSLVEGGRKGISVQSAFSSEEEVQVKAIYTLKLSVPFFRPIRFQKDTAVKRRVFSGYVKHRRDYDAAGDNSIVYVAENGVVYHKNASCSHRT